jgi:hypothetical protein
MDPARSTAQRIADARAKLEARHSDLWVSSATADGAPYLVPLSFAWDGTAVLIAIKSNSPTARNVNAGGTARLGLGTTRDVVIVDTELISSATAADDDEVAARYAAQADWDPRQLGDAESYVYLRLRPVRIQVWRESNEIAGRTVMREGVWVA